MTRLTVLALAALVSLVACAGGEVDEARADDILALEGDAASGATLFTANCQSCHGADAQSGSAGQDLPSKTEDVVVDTVLSGTTGMPSFSSLEDQEIADIVAHLASL
jgi:mono/diheme cytochrome c family protein